MTPRQVADKYPAQWQIHGQVICLYLHDLSKIGADPVTLTVYTHPYLATEIGYRGVVVGLRKMSEDIVGEIGEHIAHMIAFHPGAVDLYKIPDWAKESTGKALEAHKQRLQDVQTHLEWSKK